MSELSDEHQAEFSRMTSTEQWEHLVLVHFTRAEERTFLSQLRLHRELHDASE